MPKGTAQRLWPRSTIVAPTTLSRPSLACIITVHVIRNGRRQKVRKRKFCCGAPSRICSKMETLSPPPPSPTPPTPYWDRQVPLTSDQVLTNHGENAWDGGLVMTAGICIGVVLLVSLLIVLAVSGIYRWKSKRAAERFKSSNGLSSVIVDSSTIVDAGAGQKKQCAEVPVIAPESTCEAEDEERHGSAPRREVELQVHFDARSGPATPKLVLPSELPDVCPATPRLASLAELLGSLPLETDDEESWNDSSLTQYLEEEDLLEDLLEAWKESPPRTPSTHPALARARCSKATAAALLSLSSPIPADFGGAVVGASADFEGSSPEPLHSARVLRAAQKSPSQRAHQRTVSDPEEPRTTPHLEAAATPTLPDIGKALGKTLSSVFVESPVALFKTIMRVKDVEHETWDEVAADMRI